MSGGIFQVFRWPRFKLRQTGAYILNLFSAGEPGVWYDPSDMGTLFQDEAGTTPVTAVEQPVGRILDKSGRGNHATQATTTKRPLYSRRVNQIATLDTRTFAGAVLLKSGTGLTPVVTPNYATAPDGSMTAVRVQLDCGAGTTSTDYSLVSGHLANGAAQIVGASYKTSIWMRATSGTATVTLTGAGTNAPAQTLNETWRKVTLTETGTATTFAFRLASNGAIIPTRGPQDVLVWQPQLVLSADEHLPYQWNQDNTTYDANPAKFPAYLRFDGVDDALQTGNIDFTSTGKMTVWAGVTKLSDAAVGVLLEMSVNSVANNGTIGMFTPSGAAGNNIFQRSRGTAQTTASAAAIAPTSFIWTAASIINPPSNAARISGVQVAANTASQGAGNYGNYPLYIGAGAGTSSFFNGRLYSLIVRGAQSSLSQIEAAEVYIKQKMRLP